MNIWIDDDVPIMDLIKSLATNGLTLRLCRGEVYAGRIQRAEAAAAAIDLDAARRRQDAGTDMQIREGLRGLCRLSPEPPGVA